MKDHAVYPPYANAAHYVNFSVDRSVKAVSAEYETEVHFQKCYGVMAEIFDRHDNLSACLPSTGFRFLDLGCAPGGFSTFLLEDPRCYTGFGVTLPSLSGGFPVRVRSERFFLQQADLFELGPGDLLASDVNICICDAQYLRNNISWDEQYRGVRCRSKQHGVWALLMKQFWLGLTKLTSGGAIIFRFGWRDPGPDDPATVWYKKITLRLFTLLHDLFGTVNEVKSDYFNALQSSFYVCCANFNRPRFVSRQVAKLLGSQFNMLITTWIQDSNELDILANVDRIRTAEVDEKISDMLDRINKLRLIHEESRRRHRKTEALNEGDPKAVVVLSPAPSQMSDQQLTDIFSKYGRVRRVVRRHGGDVAVHFAQAQHANAAMSALQGHGAFVDRIQVWSEVDGQSTADGQWGACDWSHQLEAEGCVGYMAGEWAPGMGLCASADSHYGGYGVPYGAAYAAPSCESEGMVSMSAELGHSPNMPVAHCSHTSSAAECGLSGPAPSLRQQEAQPEKTVPPPSQARAQDTNGEVSTNEKPTLHPALQDHQAKTRDLIAQLLTAKK